MSSARTSNLEKHSRSLTKLLRHRVHENGLGHALRPDGYLPLDAVLALPQFAGVTATDVEEIVRTNDKQRMALMKEGGKLYVRANQGHTIRGVDEEALLGDALDLASAKALGDGQGLAVHGTYHKSWGAIQASGGLSRMSRNHIHLAAGLPGDSGVISGMRKSCEVVIWIDVAKAVAAGMRFFTSQNGVVLTPGDASGLLPTQFFHSVVDRATGQQLHSSSSSTSASSSSSTSSSSSSLQASSSAAYEPNYPSQKPQAVTTAEAATAATSSSDAAMAATSSSAASAAHVPAAAAFDLHGVTPGMLRQFWLSLPSSAFPTFEFYGHSESSGRTRCLSNFFEHAPFEFVVPAVCGAAALAAAGRPVRVPVAFTEKAIMLCKASVMGDWASYDRIIVASRPSEAKALGRSVSPFDQARWDSVVCEVARAVCVQKARALPEVRDLLLNSTGERAIAEMTKRDRHWGTGIDVGHPDASNPHKWSGTNILGWALMQARSELRAVAAGGGAHVADEAMADEEPTSPGRKRKSRERRRGSRLQSDYMVD